MKQTPPWLRATSVQPARVTVWPIRVSSTRPQKWVRIGEAPLENAGTGWGPESLVFCGRGPGKANPASHTGLIIPPYSQAPATVWDAAMNPLSLARLAVTLSLGTIATLALPSAPYARKAGDPLREPEQPRTRVQHRLAQCAAGPPALRQRLRRGPHLGQPQWQHLGHQWLPRRIRRGPWWLGRRQRRWLGRQQWPARRNHPL